MPRSIILIFLFIIVNIPVFSYAYPNGQTKVLYLEDKNIASFVQVDKFTGDSSTLSQVGQYKIELIFSRPTNWDDAIKIGNGFNAFTHQYVIIRYDGVNDRLVFEYWNRLGETTTFYYTDPDGNWDTFYELDFEIVYNNVLQRPVVYLYINNSLVGSYTWGQDAIVRMRVVSIATMQSAQDTVFYIDNWKVVKAYNTNIYLNDFESMTNSTLTTEFTITQNPPSTQALIVTIGLDRQSILSNDLSFLESASILPLKIVNVVLDISLNIINELLRLFEVIIFNDIIFHPIQDILALVNIPIPLDINFNIIPDILSLINIVIPLDIFLATIPDVLRLLQIPISNDIVGVVSAIPSYIKEVLISLWINFLPWLDIAKIYEVIISNDIVMTVLPLVSGLWVIILSFDIVGDIISYLLSLLGILQGDNNLGFQVIVDVIPAQPPGFGGGGGNGGLIPNIGNTVLYSDVFTIIVSIVGLIFVGLGLKYPYLLLIPIFILPLELKLIPLFVLSYKVILVVRNRWV